MSQEVRAWSTATNALCRGSASSRRSAGGMWAGEEGCWAPVTCSRPSGTRRTGTAHHGTRDGQVQGGPRVAPALLLAFLSRGHPPVPGGQTAPRRPTHFGENVCTQEVVRAGLGSRHGQPCSEPQDRADGPMGEAMLRLPAGHCSPEPVSQTLGALPPPTAQTLHPISISPAGVWERAWSTI